MAWTELQLVEALEVALIDNSPFLGLSGLTSWPPEALSEMEDAMERIADPIYNFVESWAIEPGTLELSYQFKTDLEDPLPGYLTDKIDNDTLMVNPTSRRLYVAEVPVATGSNIGGITIGAQPFLYLSGSNLMLNAETSPLLEGGNNMVPTSRAVKLYVDAFISGGGGGGGDMLKSTYDTANNGVVDDSERLDNQLPAYYLNWTNFTNTPTTVSGYGITDVYTDTEIDAFFEGESSGKKQVDWARIINAPTIYTDHDQLAGLNDDDHPQYVFLTGRSGDVLHIDEIQEYTTDAGVTFSDVIYATGTTGTGTGTSIIYFNRGTGELTYGDSPEGQGYPDIYYEETCTNGTTTNIVVGDTTTDTIGLQILYTIIRGSLYETGEIQLVNRSGTVSINRSSYFDNSGVTIAADVNGTDIRLNVTVPSGSDASFEYVKILQEGPNEWIGLNAPKKSQSLTGSSTTRTLLGSTDDHIAMKVQYGIIRNNLYQTGEIFVINKNGTPDVELGSVGGNVGCTFGTEINNNFIYLTSTLDAGNIASMDYHVIYIDGPRQWDVNEGAERVTTLVDDDQTDIVLGNIYNEIGIEVLYNLSRSTSRQTGKIFISDNGTTSPDYDRSSYGDNCGETMVVVVDTYGNYTLESTLTSTGNNATFRYTILPLSRPNTAGGYWDRTGTTLTTFTAGDDVDLGGKLKVDEIGEFTLDNGIDIEGILMKDADVTLPTSGRVYFNVGETTSVYDNAGVLTFVDGTTGTKTLADLATVGNPSYGSFMEIPYTNSGSNDFLYTSNFVFNTSTGALTLTGYDLWIASTGEGVKFGDGDTVLYEASDDLLYLTVGNNTKVIWSDSGNFMSIFDELNVNEITERTGSAGVTVEGVLLRDYSINFNTGGHGIWWDNTMGITDNGSYMCFTQNSTQFALMNTALGLQINNIKEYTTDAGITIEGVFLKDSILYVDDIFESTTDAGVNIEGLLLEDETILFHEVTTPGAPAANYGILYMDSADEKLYFRNSATTYDLTAAGGGTSYWSRSGTDLTPATSGDDIVLAVSTERIMFGDKDTYIFENADDDLQIYVGAVLSFRINAVGAGFGEAIYPMGTQDIGTSSAYWDDAFINRIYIGSSSQYIDVSGSDLRFTDNATTYTLTQLAASAVWSRSGTDLSPTTPGDDILLDPGESLNFSHGSGITDWIMQFTGSALSNTGIKYNRDDVKLSFLSNDTETVGIEFDVGYIRLQGGSSLFQASNAYLNTIRANVQNDLDIYAADGYSSHVAGYDVYIHGGAPYGTGNNDGGDVYIYGGDPIGTGFIGTVYIGDPNSSETIVNLRSMGSSANVTFTIAAKGGQGIVMGSTYMDLSTFRVVNDSGFTDLTTVISQDEIHLHAGNGGVASVDGPDLHLYGGTAGTVGDNDGGHVNIYGGSPNGSGNYGNIYLGHPTFGGTSVLMQTLGSASVIGLTIGAKGGQLLQLTSSTGYLAGLNVQNGAGYEEVYPNTQSDELRIRPASGGTAAVGGADLLLTGGGAGSGGNNDGGDVFIDGGAGYGTGVKGDIYFGDGASGTLKLDNGVDYLVVYDPSTGKLNYRTVASLP